MTPFFFLESNQRSLDDKHNAFGISNHLCSKWFNLNYSQLPRKIGLHDRKDFPLLFGRVCFIKNSIFFVAIIMEIIPRRILNH